MATTAKLPLIANTLLALRHERGVSLRTLAERAGVDKDSANRLELGRDVHLSTAVAVAIALRVSLDELIPVPGLVIAALAADAAASPGQDPVKAGISVPAGAQLPTLDADTLDALADPGALAAVAIDAHDDHEEEP